MDNNIFESINEYIKSKKPEMLIYYDFDKTLSLDDIWIFINQLGYYFSNIKIRDHRTKRGM